MLTCAVTFASLCVAFVLELNPNGAEPLAQGEINAGKNPEGAFCNDPK